MTRGTSYQRFNVRTLYKYIMKAIRTESTKIEGSSRKLMEQLALGRAIVGGGVTSLSDANMKTIAEAEQVLEPLIQSPSAETGADENKAGDAQQVTWRERLGGFLHPRDMRKLVTPFSASNEPELIVRRHVMVLNFDPLRAIILRDRAIVLVPDGADSLLVQLEKRIRGDAHNMFSDNQSSGMVDSDSSPSLNKMDAAFGQYHGAETVDMEDDEDLKDSLIDNEWAELDAKGWIDLPFELQSADAVLSSVSAILADDVLDLQLGANAIIADLVRPDSDVGEHAQETLRTMKNSVQEMMSRVKGFNRAIDTLLDDYEDMALMNLSRLLTHPDRFVQPVPQAVLEEESDEPELILEAHLQGGHTLINALTLVEGQIHSTEEFAVRKSDTIRNRLLFINMVISIMSLCATVFMLVASFFTMNVPAPLFANPNGFSIVVWPNLAGVLVIVTAVPTALLRLGALPNVFKRS